MTVTNSETGGHVTVSATLELIAHVTRLVYNIKMPVDIEAPSTIYGYETVDHSQSKDEFPL